MEISFLSPYLENMSKFNESIFYIEHICLTMGFSVEYRSIYVLSINLEYGKVCNSNVMWAFFAGVIVVVGELVSIVHFEF